MKANAKAVQRAVEVLAAGGYWRKALERHFHGGEKFKTRLYRAGGQVVRGFGFQCHDAMLEAGMLVRRECAVSSVWPQEWAMRETTKGAANG